MQRQQYPVALPELAFFRYHSIRCAVMLLGTAGIWLLSITADAATLRTDPSNPRYFNNGAGPVFLTGSYWVNALQDDAYTGAYDYTAYLNFLVANGHNFIRMINIDCPYEKTLSNPWADFTPMAYQRPGPGTAGDGKLKFDLSKFDQTFFDRLRARVIDAGNRGIYVGYCLFDGWDLLGNPQAWAYFPHNPANNVNGYSMASTDLFTLNNATWVALMDAYVDKVVDTLNDLDNVLYEVINEAPGSSNQWQEHVVNRIHAREATKAKQHPVGRSSNDWQTSDATSNSSMLAGGAEWVGISGREGSTYKTTIPDAPATKVSLLDSDHVWGIGGTPPNINASWVWKSLVRGHNPVYLDVNTYHSTSQYPPYSSDPAVVATMGYARALANRIDLAHMVPSDATTSTGYGLVYANREYLIYQPATSSFSVTLPAQSFRFEWINPATGSVSQSGAYNATAGSNTFNLPGGFSSGALLHLAVSNPSPTPTPTPTHTPTPTPAQATATLSAAPTSVGKGGTATFTISLSANVVQPIAVSYSTSGSAVNGTDYTLTGSPNQLIIASGQSSGTVTLNVVTTKTKGKEKVIMTLGSGTGYSLPAGRRGRPAKPPKATVTILNK